MSFFFCTKCKNANQQGSKQVNNDQKRSTANEVVHGEKAITNTKIDA